MLKTANFLLILNLTLFSVITHAQQAPPIFVSPHGNNGRSGSENDPLLSLEKAVEAAREKFKLNNVQQTIILKPGEYELKSGIEIDFSLILEAQIPGKSIIRGSAILPPPVPAPAEELPSSLPKDITGRILKFDLKAAGLEGFGPIRLNGFASEGIEGREFRIRELYFNEKALPLASWPDEGFSGYSEIHRNDKSGQPGWLLKFDKPALQRWQEEKNILLLGYWHHLWAHAWETVSGIELATNEIAISEPVNHYGIRANKPFKAVNLTSEISYPGEWSYNYQTETIYLLPPKGYQSGKTNQFELSVVQEPLITVQNSNAVQIHGIKMKGGSGDAINIINSSDVVLSELTLSGFSRDGIIVTDSNRVDLKRISIHGMGRGGIVATGGNRETLKRADYLIENCHIYDLSRIDRTYTPGILANGVGITIRKSKFHDIPSSAMRIDGNDHLIEYNEIYRCVLESDDQGAIDMWGDPTYRGNVFRYNYFYDIQPKKAAVDSIAGRAGLRLDDTISGVKIYGNIFRNSANGHFGAIQIHGGKENEIYNNIFINSKAALSFTPWTRGFWHQYIDKRGTLSILESAGELYRERYPEIQTIHSDLNYNFIRDNLIIGCDKKFLRKPLAVKWRRNRTEREAFNGGLEELEALLKNHPAIVKSSRDSKWMESVYEVGLD